MKPRTPQEARKIEVSNLGMGVAVVKSLIVKHMMPGSVSLHGRLGNCLLLQL